LNAHWQRYVVEASGYIELGMLEEAARTLEQIKADEEAHEEVLGVRLDLYMAERKWHLAAKVARHLLETGPENASVWVNLAYSVRRSETLEEAERVLLQAHALHPDNALIAYNLACYACVAGHAEEAKNRLQRALDLEPSFRSLALEDPDLRPLRDWVNRLEPQRDD
jgi:Flp pilus assembly protein TadD